MITDGIETLGYDWERIADPTIKPKLPFKVYLPRGVEDIVAAVREARQLGQHLKIRGGGHSNNGMVLEDGGSIVWTTLFDKILHVDVANKAVLVQSGARLATVDAHLRAFGFGLPVISDHSHITAGGLASVGGVSPASAQAGLFVDNVRAIEMVDWDGRRRTYTRDANPAELNRMLGATGRYGIIATLTLDIVAIDKWATVTKNKRFLTIDMECFIAESLAAMANPGDTLLGRGVWVEYPALGRILRIGQYSAYGATRPTALKRWRERLVFGFLHGLGYWAGRLPERLGRAVNFLGCLAFIFTPRYASIRNVETFTEKVFDVAVGEPIRWLAVMTPLSVYEDLFRVLHAICARYRDTHGCFTMVGLYVVGIKSPWLAAGTGERYCDLLLHLGVCPEKMSPARLESVIEEVDAACLEYGAFRYQHSRTSNDPELRAWLNPNERHGAQYALHTGTGD